MDTLTKQLIDKSAAYSSAFNQLRTLDKDINPNEVEYTEDSDIMGRFVRSYHIDVGFSDKYYFSIEYAI